MPIEEQSGTGAPSRIVSTAEEFDRFVAQAMPELLDRAVTQTKRFLKETDQWNDDVVHEKLALRWGYELVERLLVYGRSEVPCRPVFVLDSLIAKFFSQPEPLCYHKALLSPLGRFLDALAGRAVVSRDALIALYYHFYGFGQTQLSKVLGFGSVESQRVFKNFERWRQSGWQRTMNEVGITEADLDSLDDQKRRNADHFNDQADRLIRLVQKHYRKSEPDHYPCLPCEKWGEMFHQDYGHDYRVWHLAFCRECLAHVRDLRGHALGRESTGRIDLHVYPLKKGSSVIPLWDTLKGRETRWTNTTN
jgi:hypothetical protein